MYHFITATDSNYLHFGLTMFDSIKKCTKSDFTLHYLCLDQAAEDKLKSLDIKEIKTYNLKQLESDENWRFLENHTSEPNGLSSWHFCFASFFSNWLLKNNHVPYAFYTDADIYFYQDPSDIIDDCVSTGYDIGFICHKNIKQNDPDNRSGFWNVGIVFFNGSDRGKRALDLWARLTVDKSNEYYATHGNCWDQKYLEVISDKFKVQNICEWIGNLAPWNVRGSLLSPDLKWMIWADFDGTVLPKNDHKLQLLYFYHFSHFNLIKLGSRSYSWKEQRKNEWGPIIEWPRVSDLYYNYFKMIIQTKQKYNI